MKSSGFIVLACLVALSVSSRASAEGLTGTAEQRARSLGTNFNLSSVQEPQSGVEWGRAEGVIAARPDQVLAILNDYAQYAGLFPYFQKSKVLSQRGSDAIVYLEAKVLHGAATLWSQVRMKSGQSAGETRVVEARMMRGKGNISQLLARWEVTPLADGQRSYVAFQILVDPDLPLPDLAINSELRQGAGKAMRALRNRVRQRGALALGSSGST
jgi:ribosome-associated toxin RatA of RatAB toxin-antitoxin module